MTKFLSNAFSLQMLRNFPCSLTVEEITKDDVPGDVLSVIGHRDTANLLGVLMNRVNTVLTNDDELYVAQFTGGRLPEGAKVLPLGVELKFFKVRSNCFGR